MSQQCTGSGKDGIFLLYSAIQIWVYATPRGNYMKNTILTSVLFSGVLLVVPDTVQADDEWTLSTKGGIKLETKDKDKSFQIGGRIHWDYDHTDSDNDAKDKNEFAIRRARLNFKGKLGDWAYKSQFNLGEDDGGSVEDLYIQYLGFGKKAKITVGYFKEPFMLEEIESSNDIFMLERSATNEAWAPKRNGGIMLSGVHGDLFYAGGYFRDDEEDAESIDKSALTGRVVYAFLNQEETIAHVGASLRFGDESDKQGLEVAGRSGNIYAQAEYLAGDISDEQDEESFYLQAGYLINGTRPYKSGVFKGVKPNDGTAYEVAIRFEDGYGKYSDLGLGTEKGSQVGFTVSMYPNAITRLGASYMVGDTDAGVDGEEFRLRAQVDF